MTRCAGRLQSFAIRNESTPSTSIIPAAKMTGISTTAKTEARCAAVQGHQADFTRRIETQPEQEAHHHHMPG